MKKKVWIWSVLVLLLVILPAGVAEAKGNKYKLSATKRTMTEGRNYTIRLKKAKNVRWKSSDTSVVKVKKKSGTKAVIQAKKKGKATVTASYKGKKYRCKVTVKPHTYVCDREVLLRSQPVRRLATPEDYSAAAKRDEEHTEHLELIMEQIWDMNEWKKLMPLRNMCFNLRRGYDVHYGYDTYTLARIYRFYAKITSGSVDFSGEAQEMTVMDDLEAAAAAMRGTDGWTGTALRIGLAYFTAGVSEAVLMPLDINKSVMDYHKKANGKGTPLGYFIAGAAPVAMNVVSGGIASKVTPHLIKGASFVGQKVVKYVPEKAVFATQKLGKALGAAVEQVRKHDVDLNMKTLRRALGAGEQAAGTAARSAETLVSGARAEAKTLEQEIRLLSADASRVDGAQTVKQFERAWENQLIDPAAYKKALLAVQENPAALDSLRSLKGPNAARLRGMFNRDLDRIYGEASENILDRISKKYGYSRSQLKIRNVSSNEAKDLYNGLKVRHDNDITVVYINRAGEEIALPLNMTRDSVYRGTHYAFTGEEAKTLYEAWQTSSRSGQHNCQPGDAEYLAGGAETFEKLTGTTDPLGGEIAEAVSGTYRFKIMDPIRHGRAVRNKVINTKSMEELAGLRNEMKRLLENRAGGEVIFTEDMKLLMQAERDMANGIYQGNKAFKLFSPRDAQAQMMGYEGILTDEMRQVNSIGSYVSDRGLSSVEHELALKKLGISYDQYADSLTRSVSRLDGLIGGRTVLEKNVSEAFGGVTGKVFGDAYDSMTNGQNIET